jgi:hypothetical protein
LQGESTTPPLEQEGPPPGFETDVQDKANTSEKMKEIELPPSETEVPHTEKSEAGKGKELEIPSEIPENIPKKVGGTSVDRAWKSHYLFDSIAVYLWKPPRGSSIRK